MKSVVSVIIGIFLTSSLAMAGDQITKTKGNRGIVKSPSGEYAIGDQVSIKDNSGAEVGKAKVVNVSGKGVLIQVQSGNIRQGYEISKSGGGMVEEMDEAGQGGAKSMAIAGFGGLLMTDGEDLLSFGGDFIMGGMWPNINLRGGLMYSTHSEGGASMSLIDLSGGAGYVIDAGPVRFDLGGRAGFSQLEVEVEVLGVSASNSDTSFHISPYANAAFAITDALGIGGELRMPFYLDDAYDGVNFYLMAQVTYAF